MDQSYNESDVSLSPSQILERLQVLRQLQLMQRGKLQKQQLNYQESPRSNESCSDITEIVSHFSGSTSYNTFRSLLQSPTESPTVTPRSENTKSNTGDISRKVQEKDLIEGVSVLHLSQESEFLINSPLSSKTKTSIAQENETSTNSNKSSGSKQLGKSKISLDEMPILSPKQDFEALLLDKLKNEIKMNNKSKEVSNKSEALAQNKKPFLKRGEGIARFGIKKNAIVIQNTNSLPWRRKSMNKSVESPLRKQIKSTSKLNKPPIEIKITAPSHTHKSEGKLSQINKGKKESDNVSKVQSQYVKPQQELENLRLDNIECELHGPSKVGEKENKKQKSPLGPLSKHPLGNGKQAKHPLLINKGKTWAAVFTREQDEFLRQLKQSDYYKNFTSPAKSIVSDISCDETHSTLKQQRESAAQNLFELIENKVTHESFSIDNSFFQKFLGKKQLECSGDSTPLVMQRCLSDNPNLLHIVPGFNRKRNENSQSDAETCYSECTDSCSEACSEACSCKTVDEDDTTQFDNDQRKRNQKGPTKRVKVIEPEKETHNKQCQDDIVKENEEMKANMAEMNAKLVATSDLLKERLRELEDEIETFRKENTNLTKMREEIDLERQKFYEEKANFEQKFNEDKILAEYYMSEEKEKLNKQKLMYEKYVKEMRGRLNKKDKDEVVSLKNEIIGLKEEIRIKDAKSTSTIARLRNHIKIMEKEKKDLQDEVEKFKKENRRIQHSNEMTRRLSNIKYLEEINKKLNHMASKESRSELEIDSDIKYKAYEIERQSRSRRVQTNSKSNMRVRAKSVPNLHVTSRYAKYFSQKDSASQAYNIRSTNTETMGTYTCPSENNDTDDETDTNNLDDTESVQDPDIVTDDDYDNNLEKMYTERFQSTSPKSFRASLSNIVGDKPDINDNVRGFFIRKSNSSSTRDSKSPNQISPHSSLASNLNRSKSPVSILSQRSSSGRRSPTNYVEKQNASRANKPSRSRSPTIITNSSSNSKSPTVINNDRFSDPRMALSPEPSRVTKSITKTNLNPTEIRKPDGSRELRFPNGNVKHISADGKYSKFVYYNGDVKENFYSEGRIKYFYEETKTYHTTHPDGLEVFEFADGQVEKRYKDGSSEIRLPNGSVRYQDPKNEHVREEWRFPDGAAMTVSATGEKRIVFGNGQVEVHAKDHKRREFPDGTVKLVYNDGTSETRYASGRVRIKDKHGNLMMDSAPG